MALNEAPLNAAGPLPDEHALMNRRGESAHLLTSTADTNTLFAGQLHMHIYMYTLKIDLAPTAAPRSRTSAKVFGKTNKQGIHLKSAGEKKIVSQRST